jgi:tetratricopeptide (TPR) repeat protein
VDQAQRLVEKDLLESVDLYTRLAQENTFVPEHRAELAFSKKVLATFYDRRAQFLCSAPVGKLKEAVAAWQKSIDLWAGLVAEDRKQPPNWEGWINAYFNRISLWEGQIKLKEAAKDYQELVSVLEDRVKAFPQEESYIADYIAKHALGLYKWAGVLRKLNRTAEADERLKEAVQRQREAIKKKPADFNFRRLLCVYQLAAGDHKGAAASVEEWVKAVPPAQANYHEAAQVLAQCSSRSAQEDTPEGKRLAEVNARAAVELLHKAVKRQGFKNAAFLKKPAFAALQGRDDFKQVLRTIEKK